VLHVILRWSQLGAVALRLFVMMAEITTTEVMAPRTKARKLRQPSPNSDLRIILPPANPACREALEEAHGLASADPGVSVRRRAVAGGGAIESVNAL
jgi:hypothetical protein